MALYAGLADRWSKKYVMLFCPTGSILSMMVFIFASVYMTSSPYVVLVASLIDGLMGGATLLNGAVYSYIVVVCGRTGDKAIRIAIVEVFQLGGRALASFVSGDIYRATGHVFVYSVGIALNVLIYIWVGLVAKNRPGPVTKSLRHIGGGGGGGGGSTVLGLKDAGIDANELSSCTDLNSDRSVGSLEGADKTSSHHESVYEMANQEETLNFGNTNWSYLFVILPPQYSCLLVFHPTANVCRLY